MGFSKYRKLGRDSSVGFYLNLPSSGSQEKSFPGLLIHPQGPTGPSALPASPWLSLTDLRVPGRPLLAWLCPWRTRRRAAHTVAQAVRRLAALAFVLLPLDPVWRGLGVAITPGDIQCMPGHVVAGPFRRDRENKTLP